MSESMALVGLDVHQSQTVAAVLDPVSGELLVERLRGAPSAAEIADRITASGARFVFVGLGCPRQEVFCASLRPLIDVPLLGVGAAFDYHAGLLRRPPERLQRFGLEWLWRLSLEPGRLWRHYLFLNPAYIMLVALQGTRLWRPRPDKDQLSTTVEVEV